MKKSHILDIDAVIRADEREKVLREVERKFMVKIDGKYIYDIYDHHDADEINEIFRKLRKAK